MRMWGSVVVLFVLITSAWGQEQLGLRLNEKGILKVLQLAAKYNSTATGRRSVSIPKDFYKLTIKKDQLLKNPVIPVINEISNLNLDKDLDFYLSTAGIKIEGNIDPKSIMTSIMNSNENGFDLKLTLNVPHLNVSSQGLSVCEDRVPNQKKCGNGLSLSISKLRISTKGEPIKLQAVLRLKVKDKLASLSVVSVSTNLDQEHGPELDINFDSINIPKISIVINDQETELDTSRLRDELLGRKDFLGKKLLNFAGEFIASDLAEMVNVYLMNRNVKTAWQLYKSEVSDYFNRHIFLNSITGQDHTYVRPPVIAPEFAPKQDGPAKIMMDLISEIIINAEIDLELKSVSAPANKDLELTGAMDFILNMARIKVPAMPLPELDLTHYRQNDVTLALSRPLLNGALEVINSTHLFQELFDEFAAVAGFSIKNIKLHFRKQNLVAVANVQIDLNSLSSSNISKILKNAIAAFLERHNNKGVIYLPLELEIEPSVRNLPQGGIALDFKIKSPFKDGTFINTYNYPTNVPQMTETVRKGVMKELETSLAALSEKPQTIDLTKILNQAGVEFRPKTITVDRESYLILGLDIIDINFNGQRPLH